MFDFLSMADDYEDRKVDRYESGDLIVDTVGITDGEKSFETGIRHPDYDDGAWIIVESYDSLLDAKVGHEWWVKIMTADSLPDKLIDRSSSHVGSIYNAISGETEFPRTINLKGD